MKLYLHQFLGRCGVFPSKKAVLDAVRSGLIKVDGKIVRNPKFQVKAGKARVFWSEREVKPPEGHIYILLNKPAGYLSSRLSSSDINLGKKSVFQILERDLDQKTLNSLFCVGRLDEQTSGLLLLTNDGKLCSRITNPRHGIEKTYEAVLDAPLSREALSKLESGVEILLEENGRKKRYKTKGCKITECKPDFKTVHVTLSEGKKREVRRMFESLGLKVLRLARIAIGKISLEGSKLKEGCYTLLDRDFIQRRLT